MRKVAIYSDFPLTFTAFPAHSVSKFDIIVEMSEADWVEYQRVETKYAEWQHRLERHHSNIRETGPRQNVKRIRTKAKAG